MKFSAIGFAPEIIQALEKIGYTEMTPVQAQAIVPARRGKDLLVNAQTGTGKTAAFALPLLQQMLDKPKVVNARTAKVLILTPTRELAEQLAQIIGAYGQYLSLNIVALYGGVKLGGQANKLQPGVDVLIATPGRLLEHIELDHINLAETEYVVLDEADRMLDMGFVSDVKNIVAQTAPVHQTLLFSATTTAALNELAHGILKSHEEIRISKANTTAETVTHVVYPVSEDRKMDLFLELLEEFNWYQILVFTSTKKQADHLLDRLKKTQVPAAICHGDKSQGTRRRALADFKSAKIQVLIATEVAARGIDIEGLDFVLNYNLPYLPEDYVHRIGRTGRAGNFGQAISFLCPEEEHTLDRIERLIGVEVKKIYKRGYELPGRERERKSKVKQPQRVKGKKEKNTKFSKGVSSSKPKGRKKKSITSRAGGKKSKTGKRR